jgi:acetyl-CoA carboxylase carboxyl transferase subunit alpha
MPTYYQLDFEKPLNELDARIKESEQRLRERVGPGPAPVEGPVDPVAQTLVAELASLRSRYDQLLREIYTRLTPIDVVRIARHPLRPQTRDYLGMIFTDFTELHGDRHFGDDPAIVTGFARLAMPQGPKLKVLVVGHQKGKETSEKIACHFGCAHPEGYRKALRAMRLAEKYGVPIVTLVDTPGAYPGLGAEQRGQAEAIAVNLLEMSRLRTPIVSVVIGEGGSGGALGIAVADKVGMLQYAWYSVISPEGCAAILWKEANEQTNTAAARALKLTASDNLELGIVDEVVPEPVGGAHRDPRGAADALRTWVAAQIGALRQMETDALLQARYERFRKMGTVIENAAAPTQG